MYSQGISKQSAAIQHTNTTMEFRDKEAGPPLEEPVIPETLQGRIRIEMLQQQIIMMALQSNSQKTTSKKITCLSKVKNTLKLLWKKLQPQSSVETDSLSSSSSESETTDDDIDKSYF